MVKKDGAETRRERIKEIARSLQAAFHEKKEKGEKLELQLSKFISSVMFNTGLTKEKVILYLEVIQDMDQCGIDFDNDKVRKTEF